MDNNERNEPRMVIAGGRRCGPRLCVTTMEAADILNVSRPYVIKLLEAGEMSYHLVGSHRRIRLKDVLIYKERIKREREAIRLNPLREDGTRDQMVAEAQVLGLYD